MGKKIWLGNETLMETKSFASKLSVANKTKGGFDKNIRTCK